MRFYDPAQIPSLQPANAPVVPGLRILRRLTEQEKQQLSSILDSPAGAVWPLSVHRSALLASRAGGRLLTVCLGLSDEAILAFLALSGGAGLYYCTNGEIGVYASRGIGLGLDMLSAALTISVAVYLGGPSLMAGNSIVVGISGGEFVVAGASMIFNAPPPPFHINGFQCGMGIGFGEMPITATITASHTWEVHLATVTSGGVRLAVPVPGSPTPGSPSSVPRRGPI
jgi:hypothetical protein